jgi:hypothetical protein
MAISRATFWEDARKGVQAFWIAKLTDPNGSRDANDKFVWLVEPTGLEIGATEHALPFIVIEQIFGEAEGLSDVQDSVQPATRKSGIFRHHIVVADKGDAWNLIDEMQDKLDADRDNTNIDKLKFMRWVEMREDKSLGQDRRDGIFRFICDLRFDAYLA